MLHSLKRPKDRDRLVLALLWSAVSMVVGFGGASLPTANQSFYDNFFVTWGEDHITLLEEGTAVDLALDSSSGCGFASNHSFLFGYLSMDIRLVAGDSAGTITTFYLSSAEEPHEELDFEFLGNTPGQPIVLQTNVFANGTGGREQRFKLWFDPTSEFHTYSILWNFRQIITLVDVSRNYDFFRGPSVEIALAESNQENLPFLIGSISDIFFVDSLPIRVYPNKEGAPFPSKNRMCLYSTLYNGDRWATNGGETKINWTNAPFVASYRNFFLDACQWYNSTAGLPFCSFMQTSVWWGGPEYQTLNAYDQALLQLVRNASLTYDYCADADRYPIPPPEC